MSEQASKDFIFCVLAGIRESKDLDQGLRLAQFLLGKGNFVLAEKTHGRLVEVDNTRAVAEQVLHRIADELEEVLGV